VVSRDCAVALAMALAVIAADGRAPSGRAAEVQSARDRLCGTTRRKPPVIDRDSVGPIRLSYTIETVRLLCPEGRDTVDEYQQVPALALTVHGSVILVSANAVRPPRGPARGGILSITVLGGLLRTREGLGAGSTVADLTRVYGPLEVDQCGDQVGAIDLMAVPGTRFLFDLCPVDHSRRYGSAPDSLRAIGVSIFKPLSEEP
jgi:hypothetical protein